MDTPWGTQGTAPDPALAHAVAIADIRAAATRIEGVASRTPTLCFARLDERAGAQFILKCENLQPIGAFKIRGATNAMLRLDDDARARSVLTYSSGNHAQAIAYAAARLAVPAVIVMPDNAPRVKLDATRRFLADAPAGSEVVLYDPARASREVLGRQLAEERGLHLIPPYDHPDVIAGQGTAALELLENHPDLDALFVPCGGGGLLSGSAVAAKALAPACRVVGVEPDLADDATRSFNAGVLHTVHNPPTIADGARTPFLGRYTFPLVRAHVDEMMTVTEAEIARATLLCFDMLRLVVEPSGALGLAGAIRQATRGSRVGVIVSGGNIDFDRLRDLRTLAGQPE
ncbi:MAG: pyridoxal-phosphate dependent enzyme [Phycisphaeraceae bacterium]|nr:MAG: pyridoxal-phosphate dependent enzyme [Phycisphaeraceae bacterium]